MADKLTFYRTLQFLSSTRTCHFKKEILNGELNYTFSFSLVDFAKQIDLHPLDTYQPKKLQSKRLIEIIIMEMNSRKSKYWTC